MKKRKIIDGFVDFDYGLKLFNNEDKWETCKKWQSAIKYLLNNCKMQIN